MQESIREREKAQHPAEAYQIGLPQKLPGWTDRQCEHEEDQRPIARLVCDELNRIRSQPAAQSPPDKVQKR